MSNRSKPINAAAATAVISEWLGQLSLGFLAAQGVPEEGLRPGRIVEYTMYFMAEVWMHHPEALAAYVNRTRAAAGPHAETVMQDWPVMADVAGLLAGTLSPADTRFEFVDADR